MGSELVSVSQTCSLFPACPTLHLTLLLCVNSYTLMRTPSLLSCCYGTLRLSLGCFRFQRRCILPASTFLRAGATLPLLFLSLLYVHPASPHPPLPRHIAWLAFHRQQQEEKKEN